MLIAYEYDPNDPEELRKVNGILPGDMGDITGKVVVVKAESLGKPYQRIDRRFRADVGFGTKPYTMGGAVFGTYLVDGEEARIERDDVAGLAANPDLPTTKFGYPV